MLERVKSNILFYAAVFLPALAALGYILAFGVNVPFSDEWYFVPFLKAYYGGQGWLEQLYAQFNEQRMLFPRLVFLLSALTTGWNVQAVMVFNWALSCISFAVLFAMMNSTGTYNKGALVLSSLLFFNVGQWENMLWAWQAEFYLMILAVLGGIFFLARGRGAVNLATATALGTIASYSYTNGLLIWPLGLAQILFLDLDRPKKKAWLFVWAAVGLMNIGFYFHGYARPALHPSLLSSLDDPAGLVVFFFANLGSMLGGRDIALSAGIGALVFVAYIYLLYMHYKKKTLSALMPWLMISLFSVGSSVLISLGRMAFGLKQALAPKYTSVTVLLIISILVFAAEALRRGYFPQGQLNRYIMVSSLTVVLFGIASFYCYGLVWGYKTCKERKEARRYILSYATAPDRGLELSGVPAAFARESARFLEDKRLSVFLAR